jgi:hypothetical protein
MAAHLAFSNMRLQDRPSFHTSFLENGTPVITASVPRAAELRAAEGNEFGRLLSRFCADYFRGASEWKDIEEPLLQGRYTFLVDSDGKALVDKEYAE